jgi:hypothetical protein
MDNIWHALYDKVKAYLLGGTAAAGISGALLWVISQFLDSEMPTWLPGLVTALCAQAVGLYVAYQKTETKTAVVATTTKKSPY